MAIVAAMVLALIAWAAYGVAVQEYRYSLAGWGEEYVLVPEWTIAAGAVLTVLLAAAMVLIGRRSRRVSPSSRLRWRWWLVPLAAWLGYFSGAGVVIAGGGYAEQPGSLTIEVGAPIGWSVRTDVACRSVVGDPSRIAEVLSGDVRVTVRSLPLGGDLYDPPTFDYPRRADLIPPAMSARPPIVREWLNGDHVASREELAFYGAYDWRVARSWADESSGRIEFDLRRLELHDTSWLRYSNLDVAGDPWPQAVTVTYSWTCLQPATS